LPRAESPAAVRDTFAKTIHDTKGPVSKLQVWNPDYAFAYPSLAVNARGDVAIVLAWGGKNFCSRRSIYRIGGDLRGLRCGGYVCSAVGTLKLV
jgi:hypothetical protein